MNAQAPTVSLGVPVYNGEKYLAVALDALLTQTYGDFELIISDNSSTDRTEQICRDYAARDGRIRYYQQTANLGSAANFNKVFELSRGKYFKWAAYDDMCHPEFLERCVEVLEGDPAIVWCHAQTKIIDANGDVIESQSEAAPVAADYVNRLDEPAHLRFRRVLLGTGWTVRSYGLIRADALRQCTLEQSYYGSEKVTMAELVLLGSYYEISALLFYERAHCDASSNLPTKAQQQQFCAPQRSHYFVFPRLQQLAGFVKAVTRHKLSPADRLFCLIWICNYLCQFRKWMRVLTSFVRGTGTGGAHVELVRELSSHSPEPTVESS